MAASIEAMPIRGPGSDESSGADDDAAAAAPAPPARRASAVKTLAAVGLATIGAFAAAALLRGPAPTQANLKGTIEEHPDDIFELYDWNTPIDGSSHWVTCWHTDISKCPAPHSDQCCCKDSSFFFVREMSAPMLQAVAAAQKTESDSKVVQGLQAVGGLGNSAYLRQFSGKCIKQAKLPDYMGTEFHTAEKDDAHLWS